LGFLTANKLTARPTTVDTVEHACKSRAAGLMMGSRRNDMTITR